VQSLDIKSCQYHTVNLVVYEICNKCMQFRSQFWGIYALIGGVRVNTQKISFVVHRKLGQVLRGFEGALEYLLKLGKTIFTLYPNTRMDKN